MLKCELCIVVLWVNIITHIYSLVLCGFAWRKVVCRVILSIYSTTSAIVRRIRYFRLNVYQLYIPVRQIFANKKNINILLYRRVCSCSIFQFVLETIA